MNNFWKDKRVVLTGHTGFKGSWLSLWLLRMGAILTGYSKSVPTNPSMFELCGIKEDMVSIDGDIRNLDNLKNTIDEFNPEIVIHMAAQSLVHESYKYPLETLSTNIMGTANILQSIRDTKVKVLINVTSDKCYENNNLERGYNENDPMGGFDPYSCSKGCAEIVTSSFRRSFFETGTAIATVRAGNVIGGGDWGENRIVPDIMNALLKKTTVSIRNPNAVRPWQFVLEPLNGYLMLAQKMWHDSKQFSDGWNFGPDCKDIKPVSYLLERLSTSDNIKYDKGNFKHEANILKLDCTKAIKRLGWHPKTNLDQGLEKITEWYKWYESKGNMREITEKQIEWFEKL